MKKKEWLQNSAVVCIMASICCALWGSAFPFIKIGYTLLEIKVSAINSQILFAGIRFTLAGIMTVILGSCISKRVMLPTVGSINKIIILGLLQTVVQYVFFYIGLSHTSGVKASIIEGLNVFISLLIASILFRQEKLTGNKLFGCIIGFFGVIVVNMNSNGFQMDFKLMGEGFIILSTVAYAFSSVLFKQYAKKENAVMLSGYQFIAGGVVMMAVGYITGGRIDFVSIQSIQVLIYLAFLSAVAYALWGILLKYNPVSKVTIYGFMTPVFGVILSALLLGETQYIGDKLLLALILVSAGIYLVNKTKRSVK